MTTMPGTSSRARLLSAFAERHPAASYFGLAFAISWFGVLIAVHGTLPARNPSEFEALLPVVAVAMVLGPSIAGLLMMVVTSGELALRTLWRHATGFRTGLWWYAFAAVVAPTTGIVVISALSLIWPEYRPGILTAADPASYVALGIGLSVLAGSFEEIGWTGFATPLLLKRYGMLKAGIVIGVLWSAWHLLVSFWAAGNGYAGNVPLTLWLTTSLLTTLLVYRVLMVWVYSHTRSLAVAIVMHASLTATVRIVNPTVTGAPLLWYDIAMAVGLWFVVAVIALSGRWARPSAKAGIREGVNVAVHGFVSPGFEPVRDAFIENFTKRRELGGACSVYHHGEKVVDLWGGVRNAATGEPWLEDTMVVVYSATKGLAAMTLAIANARGWLDYDERIATYWPEFAQNGKVEITVRQLLAHQAGLFAFDEPVERSDVADLDRLATILARQTPASKAGARQSYHALTLGFYENELLRRVDPKHRSLGQVFRDEIATALDIDFYIGLPQSISNYRLAGLERPSLLATIRGFPIRTMLDSLNPRSNIHRALIVNPGAGIVLDAERIYARNLEVPSGGGVGTARAIAKAYDAFACGGHDLGLTAETFTSLIAPPIPSANGFHDDALHGDVCFSLGFMRPNETWRFGSDEWSFGSPGAGGAMGYGDPTLGLGYGYVTSRMGTALTGDPRDVALRAALHSALTNAATPVAVTTGV